MSIKWTMYKRKYIMSIIQYIQREECAYLYKCKWWASVLCQTQFCTPNHRFWFVCFFPPPSPILVICIRAVCNVGKTMSINLEKCELWLDESMHKAQRPVVTEKFLLFPFSSFCSMVTVVFLFLIFKKCYFTVVVSYFCKRFANQNAMYSRYGLYFRFTALQTVCKYDRLNEWKEVTMCSCSIYLHSFF